MFKRLGWMVATVFSVSGLALLACSAEPDFQLLDGSSHRIADFRGRWLVVNYWAEWCEPCRRELPELANFAAMHQADVSVLGVNFDAPAMAELRVQVERLQVPIPVIASEPVPRLPFTRPTGLPATWLVDPTGQVHGPLLGPQTEASLLAALRKIDPEF